MINDNRNIEDLYKNVGQCSICNLPCIKYRDSIRYSLDENSNDIFTHIKCEIKTKKDNFLNKR